MSPFSEAEPDPRELLPDPTQSIIVYRRVLFLPAAIRVMSRLSQRLSINTKGVFTSKWN